MFGLSLIATAVALLSALFAWLDPNEDRERLAEARRELRRRGCDFERGSAEETRALRCLLESGSLPSQ